MGGGGLNYLMIYNLVISRDRHIENLLMTDIKKCYSISFHLPLFLFRTKYRCRKKEWKPEEPKCLTLHCSVPKVDFSIIRLKETLLPPTEKVPHGTEIQFSCTQGYKRLSAKTFP